VKKEEKKEQKESVGETKTVEVEAELQASADDLWGLLTEEGKIPMWSRSAAQVSARLGPRPGEFMTKRMLISDQT